MKEIQQLQKIVKSLNEQYKEYTVFIDKNGVEKKEPKFTLDGKLVGDIGEVIAAKAYGLELYSSNNPKYDGRVIGDETKEVQIKATMKGNISFPNREDMIPDYFLAVQIENDGSIDEIYNGTGQLIWNELIIKGKRNLKAKNPFKLSVTKLKGLRVDPDDKLKRVDGK